MACVLAALLLALNPASAQETNAAWPVTVPPPAVAPPTNAPGPNTPPPVVPSSMPSTNPPAVDPSPTQVETLICIRHGEKTQQEEGQLTPQGLNRALALPQLLISKYGKPQFIFAPDPAVLLGPKDHQVAYVRPLATIEPTAILLGMPVNTSFGFDNISGLEDELNKPDYANAVVFIAWEHLKLEKFARNEVVDHGGDGTQVPKWSGHDFDSIYIVKLTGAPGARTAAFTLEHEGLDNLSKTFPSPAAP